MLLIVLMPLAGYARHIEPPAPAETAGGGCALDAWLVELLEPGTAAESDAEPTAVRDDEWWTKPALAPVPPFAPPPAPLSVPVDANRERRFDPQQGFAWSAALQQSFLFNSFLQVWRVTMEAETRAELGGPFFKDYFRSVKGLRGWDDGDNFLTNYIGHPMQGAVSGRIQIHNDPRGVGQDFGLRREYLNSRLKALGWSALFSINFELGPLSEASIGNVGMKPREKSQTPMAFVDLVVTPTVGTAWLIAEDAIDRFLVRHLESRISNVVLRATVRGLLNPTRSMANLMRFKYPWHRDNRSL
ncbi:MAG: hypothetical protein KF868_01060 [Acidobacteria bacterium]|nr:hypothetical protein [Acidobacteriota bacterium]MCW5970424.1 hypothetical protein [Blastocatellales bacterium]